MTPLGKQTLLIVAAHPDDEALGCAGLISRVKEEGGKVFVLFLTNGTTYDFTPRGISTATEREKEIENVAKFLKYDNYKIAFPGNKFHLQLDSALSQKDLMDEIERGSISMETTRPTMIAFPNFSDYNQDHKAVAKASFASCRPSPNNTKSVPKIVASYEHTTGGWGLEPSGQKNLFIQLSAKNLKDKIQALKLYKSQVRKNPHPRSVEKIEALAKYRGALCGAESAEAFYLHRIII
ncbi:MAG: PIG-L family deacetylase [Candidatus Woykebacteria bacterium]